MHFRSLQQPPCHLKAGGTACGQKTKYDVCLECGLFMYKIIYNGDKRRNTRFKTDYVANNLLAERYIL